MAKEWIVPDEDLGVDGAYFDYQEIIRCKDCQFYHDTLYGHPCTGYCGLLEYTSVKEDDYCSNGKRR